MSAKERPILFSAPMVRAILEGRKTQTRRVVKPQPDADGISDDVLPANPYGYAWRDSGDGVWHCPYGQPGDRLWVREAWMHILNEDVPPAYQTLYRATCLNHPDQRWKPSIHMPRWASRIDLEVTGVRVERLQDISERDATADGGYSPITRDCKVPKFRELWESINGPESWDASPWVWVVEFKRIKP